jgi:hypothetical protein
LSRVVLVPPPSLVKLKLPLLVPLLLVLLLNNSSRGRSIEAGFVPV